MPLSEEMLSRHVLLLRSQMILPSLVLALDLAQLLLQLDALLAVPLALLSESDAFAFGEPYPLVHGCDLSLQLPASLVVLLYDLYCKFIEHGWVCLVGLGKEGLIGFLPIENHLELMRELQEPGQDPFEEGFHLIGCPNPIL
jgi:hypothetical protein